VASRQALGAQEFKAGKSPIMLATDVAARGLGAARLAGF
jgi:superfamily II DNA/RNA helicase